MSMTEHVMKIVKPEAPRPHRVVLSRKAGWRMPANTMKVDRSTPFGNPFRQGDSVNGETFDTVEDAIAAYREWAKARLHMPAWQKLKGRNLACWCRTGEPCHADVLLELVNPRKSGNEKAES